MVRLCVLAAHITLLAGGVCEAQPLPTDFAIRFEFGLCTTDILDTFTGVFVRDMGAREAAISAPVVLTAGHLQSLHEAVVSARFSEYPSPFRVRGTIAFGPSQHYRLTVRSAGTTHSVFWRDGIRPSTPEADRLRGLFTTVTQLILDLPQVKALPIARVGCG